MKVIVEIMGDYQREYKLRNITTLGRDLVNTIVIQDRLVSRRHAEIRRNPDGRYEIFDLGSTHGTFVCRKKIKRKILSEGDEIFLGATRLYLRETPAEGTVRRWDERVACDIPVRIKIGRGQTIETRATDISLGGMRLALDRQLDPDTEVELSIAFPHTCRRFRVKAYVVHGGSDHKGVGVALWFRSNREQARLARQVSRLMLDPWKDRCSGDRPSKE